MKITNHYQPGTTIVLFDHAHHKSFQGTLYFTPDTALVSPIEGLTSSKKLTKSLLIMLLIISLMGIGSLTLPVVVASMVTHFGPIHATQQVPSGELPPHAKYKTAGQLVPVEQQFRIAIPKINVESRVVPHVDVVKEAAYLEALKQGVAHAQGSYLPNEQGPMVLFAHSTDTINDILQYNAKFYAVKDLEVGDEIVITYQGKQYHYQVEQQQIISPTDLDSIRQSNANLILVTCYPPGTDWQRLVTYARLAP